MLVHSHEHFRCIRGIYSATWLSNLDQSGLCCVKSHIVLLIVGMLNSWPRPRPPSTTRRGDEAFQCQLSGTERKMDDTPSRGRKSETDDLPFRANFKLRFNSYKGHTVHADVFHEVHSLWMSKQCSNNKKLGDCHGTYLWNSLIFLIHITLPWYYQSENEQLIRCKRNKTWYPSSGLNISPTTRERKRERERGGMKQRGLLKKEAKRIITNAFQ